MNLSTFTAVGGRRRYSVAIFTDALGAGLLRPFMFLYGLRVLGLGLAPTGIALTIGLTAGLGAIPLVGRWIDRAGPRRPVVFALVIRVFGVLALLFATGLPGFVLAAALLSTGTQVWPGAHAALVSTLTSGRERDVALSAGRALRNAGLGAGALLATVTLAGGVDALRLLAALSAIGYLGAAALVWSMDVPTYTRPDRSTHEDTVGRTFLVLCLLNLPFALIFDVLEVALPAVFLEQLQVGSVWPGAVFIANTVLVISLSVPLVVRFAHRPRRWVLGLAGLVLATSYLGFLWATGAGGHLGAAGVVLFSVVFTLGEILYAGTGTALVIATAPPGRLGRTLARWELSTGIGKASAPIVLTGLLGVAPAALWLPLAIVTATAGLAIARYAPRDALST